MTIDVLLNGTATAIDRAVFTTLLDNSVAGTYAGYRSALESGSIRFSDLVFLARKGDIPYCLFFAPRPLVEAQVAIKTSKLLAGLSKDTFSINSRQSVRLQDVELIVKDLIRKQELLKRHDESLTRNRIVGLLRKPGRSTEEDGARLASLLGIDRMRTARTKGDALEALIARLEVNQVLVSRSVPNYMPQRLNHVSFSGMTIKDNKVPYIFLAGGDHGDYQEPEGRTIFTLALLAVLVARRVFAPVTWDGQSTGSDVGPEYDITGAMLMPANQLRMIGPSSLDDMKRSSDEFKVTPSAVTVRAMRLGLISAETARAHLDELRVEMESRPKPAARSPIRPENAVRKYNGREFSLRMLDALDASRLSQGEFCRTVCLNHIKPSQIGDLRGALA